MNEKDKTCGECAFFKADTSGADQGYCVQLLVETSANLPEGVAFMKSDRPYLEKLVLPFSCFSKR